MKKIQLEKELEAKLLLLERDFNWYAEVLKNITDEGSTIEIKSEEKQLITISEKLELVISSLENMRKDVSAVELIEKKLSSSKGGIIYRFK